MKTADITDERFLRAVVDATKPGWSNAMWWEVQLALAGRPDLVGVGSLGPEMAALIEQRVPAKIVLSKARRVIGRGLLEGCPCGCRGDFALTAAGRRFLDDAARAVPLGAERPA